MFKISNINIENSDHFWEVSETILSKIEGDSYSKNRKAHIEFLLDNPKVAKRRGVNISGHC